MTETLFNFWHYRRRVRCKLNYYRTKLLLFFCIIRPICVVNEADFCWSDAHYLNTSIVRMMFGTVSKAYGLCNVFTFDAANKYIQLKRIVRYVIVLKCTTGLGQWNRLIVWCVKSTESKEIRLYRCETSDSWTRKNDKVNCHTKYMSSLQWMPSYPFRSKRKETIKNKPGMTHARTHRDSNTKNGDNKRSEKNHNKILNSLHRVQLF